MDRTPEIYIDSCIRAVPGDLLRLEGTIIVTFEEGDFRKDGNLFLVKAEGYIFSAGLFGGHIVLQRNEYEVRVSVTHTFKPGVWITIFFEWSPTLLRVSYGFIPSADGTVDREREAHTPYSLVPATLVTWVRKQNLIANMTYNSETEFRDKVYSIIESLQRTVDTLLSENGFWDITYNKGRIVSKLPKRETDIHSVLHGILMDQFLMSSIEVVPEYNMGAGRIDFMLIGIVTGNYSTKVCLEIKNAHSPELSSGLIKQLPTYMENSNVQNGIYLVLWYGMPSGIDGSNKYEDLSIQLYNLQVVHHGSLLSKRIRVFCLDLTKSPSASH